MDAKLYYTIGEVADMMNTSTSQLRYWSGEFNLKLRKNRKGDRLFQKQDLEKLRHIQYMLKEDGYTIEGAKKKLKSSLKERQLPDESVPEVFRSLQTTTTDNLNIEKEKLSEVLKSLKRIKSDLEMLKLNIKVKIS